MNGKSAQDDPYRSPETELTGAEIDLYPATPCPACKTPPSPFTSWQTTPWRFRCSNCQTLFGMRTPHLAAIVIGTALCTLVTLFTGDLLGTYLGYPVPTALLGCLLLACVLMPLAWRYQLKYCQLYYLDG